MPYKRKGKVIYHKKGGKWSIKQRCTSIANAIAALNLLRAKEHNPSWKPTGKARLISRKRKTEKRRRRRPFR